MTSLSSGSAGFGIVLGALAVLAGITVIIRGQMSRHRGVTPRGPGGRAAPCGSVGAIVLVALLALRRTPTPQLRAMPWWGWLGGFCAATYVTATFLLIPTIGAAVTVALAVTGQQLASAFIDQYGWFRMPRRPLTGPRIGGLVLLIAGSVLVQFT